MIGRRKWQMSNEAPSPNGNKDDSDGGRGRERYGVFCFIIIIITTTTIIGAKKIKICITLHKIIKSLSDIFGCNILM